MTLRSDLHDELMAYEDSVRRAVGERYQAETMQAASSIIALFREYLLSDEAVEAMDNVQSDLMLDTQYSWETLQRMITAALNAAIGAGGAGDE